MARLGTESAFELLARAKVLEAQGHDIINLGIGQPDFRTPDHIVEAGQQALTDGHHGYTPGNGILPLREAVAEDVAKFRAVEISPDQVVIVPGGKVTMWYAILMFGEPGAEIMYPNPGFPIYESVINYSGAKAVPIPLREENQFAFDAEEVLDKVTSATRLVILNSPANPTGGVVPREQFDRLVRGLEAHPEVMVLSDEIYSRLLYEGAEFVSLLEYESLRDRLIILDGWSKTYAMTGWRIGYGVWPEPLVDIVTRLNINSVSCTNAATQFAAIAALSGPQDSVAEMARAFDERRKLIVQETNLIPGFSSILPQGAFYTMPNITGTGLAAKQMETFLLDELGIAAVAGTSFGAYGEGYMRFSYANSSENIQRAMDRIRERAVTENCGKES
ncbi:MAG TPA: aminotransferase class I/II-fold pyridoxal phosphate-dependent enzyme [Alphaproteobacteria bacterium]|nr:aminotransferase class I/II-fold pyridoxal phosphate-dependent enzyme [Alphaproteobacteria bacterium]